MPDYLELQLSCLAGGTILQVHSLAEAEAAERWGAAAIFFSDLGVLSEADLGRLVEKVSLHPFCAPEDFSRLSAAYKERTAHHFARLPMTRWGEAPRAVADVENRGDLRTALDPKTDTPYLILCKDETLLPDASRMRKQEDARTLVFVESDTLEGGAAALRDGAHGVLLTRKEQQSLPTPGDQKLLMKAVIEAPVGVWPQGKRVIGVMSHQGDYPAHVAAFETAIRGQEKEDEVAVKEVRTKAQYDLCDAIVLPGGWSNLQTLYLAETGLDNTLRVANETGLPILGTCAGMILCGAVGGEYTEGRVMLGLIPGTVDNNIVDGVTAVKTAGNPEGEDILFSNGPVLRAFSDDVRVLARTCEANQVVAAQHGSTFVFSYHDYGNTHPEFLRYCLRHWSKKDH